MNRKKKNSISGILIVIISLLMLALAAAGLVFVILPHLRGKEEQQEEKRSVSTSVVSVKSNGEKEEGKKENEAEPDDNIKEDELPAEQLEKNPSIYGNYNNIGDGGRVCVNDSGTGLFYADTGSQELLFISEESYNVVQYGYCRSLSAADGRIYYICDGVAYSCADDGSDAAEVEGLAGYEDLQSLYVSDEYYFVYEINVAADPGARRARIVAVSRQSGAMMGSVSLGYAAGDDDYGTKQFIIADNGYLYYILRSDDGIYYDEKALDHIWRLPAGDMYAEPESVIYALDDRLHYRQLLCEGDALYVLYENRDGNSAVTMYDMEGDSILSDKYWAKEKYGFSTINVRDGVLYVSVVDYMESHRAIWAIVSSSGDTGWMGREILSVEPGLENGFLAVDDTANGACLFFGLNDDEGNVKLGYVSLEDEEDTGYIIE